MCSRSM